MTCIEFYTYQSYIHKLKSFIFMPRSQGNCNSSPNSSKCCREEHFINFRELTWTQYWIIEPAGYQAFRCAGGCKQPKHSYHGYGQRTCVVMESAPLPMMYLVKKGDYTEIEVAEFPNMIVEKCGCSMDNIPPVWDCPVACSQMRGDDDVIIPMKRLTVIELRFTCC